MLLLSIADLFFATQLNVPVTVIGARSFAATDLLINRNQVKFPLPGNTTIEQNILNSIDSTNTIGSKLAFEKRIGRNDYYITPGNLSIQEKFYESAIREPVFKNPVLYFADTILQAGHNFNPKLLNTYSFAILPAIASSITDAPFYKDTIAIKKLSANTIECLVQKTTPGLLVFLQNAYPGWKVFIDGKETAILKTNICFMGVNIPAGKHKIVFSYYPEGIVYAWYVSLLTFISIGLYFIGLTIRKRFLSH